MSFARVYAAQLDLISGKIVSVEVDTHPGLHAFTIVGLPDKAVGESKERVRAALHALGLSIPAKRLTVNLAPADLAGLQTKAAPDGDHWVVNGQQRIITISLGNLNTSNLDSVNG